MLVKELPEDMIWEWSPIILDDGQKYERLNLPELQLQPELNLPELNLPELNLPELQLPELNLPELQLQAHAAPP